MDNCITNIPATHEKLVPQALVSDATCKNAQEFVNLCTLVYKLLNVKVVQLEEATQFLNVKFLQGLSAGRLNALRASTEVLAGLEVNFVGIYKLLKTIQNTSTLPMGSTRGTIISIVTALDDQQINQVLEKACQQEGDIKDDPEYKYKLFGRYIILNLKSLEFLHKKARMAIEFYYEVEHLQRDIEKLKSDYQLMLTSLESRATVNLLGHHVMMSKKLAMEKLSTYAKYWEEGSAGLVFCFLPDVLHVYPDFTFEQAANESWILKDMCYTHVLHIPEIHPESLPLFKKVTADLEPIIAGIRSFQPSPLELATEKARYMKGTICRIKNAADEFLSQEGEKTIGKAKSLLEQIQSVRGVIDSLQMSGLEINDATIGIKPDDLENYYVKVSDALAQREYESKVSEAKATAASRELAKGAPQLELPPLTGFSSWLNFRKAINDIMPLHSNSLIKRQILLQSLKNREDLSRCQSMSYEDGFKYLVQRYDSAALIPGLIDELLALKSATSDRAAYENLTQLISTTTMIQSYEQLDKLDSNARSKLVFILLHRELQLAFLKDQFIFEEGIKKEFCPDTVGMDAISEISCLQTQEVEAKRRTWWLEQMTRCLSITRELIKTQNCLDQEPRSHSSQSFSAELEESSLCPICNITHKDRNGQILYSLSRCQKFRRMDLIQRLSVVDSNDFCHRCLRPKANGNHNGNICKMAKDRKYKCTFCHLPNHHPLLHPESTDEASSNKISAEDESNALDEQSPDEDEDSSSSWADQDEYTC